MTDNENCQQRANREQNVQPMALLNLATYKPFKKFGGFFICFKIVLFYTLSIKINLYSNIK